tara:strand:+ start:197 stop:1339 length:1143 start_codon:yes stop_codon:yes gene_type:complete
MRNAEYSKMPFDSPEPPSRPSMLAKGCCGLLFVACVVAFVRPGAAEAGGGKHARIEEAGGGTIEAHQKREVSSSLLALRQMRKGRRILARLVEDDAPIPAGSKKVQFIRHGEGYHNVAQREWRARPGWDGKTEPYTIDTDPNGRYVDPLLTEAGEEQARALQARTCDSSLYEQFKGQHAQWPTCTVAAPQLLVVSPMRRATQTGLLAFAPHVATGQLPVLAHELCHERAGRHTCDRRLSRAELTKQFGAIVPGDGSSLPDSTPKMAGQRVQHIPSYEREMRLVVSYVPLETEEDPYWGDGVSREPWDSVVARAAGFVEWLRARPETHIAVASHSAWLLAMFNAVLTTDDGDRVFISPAAAAPASSWFGTGEMRTVLLTWE